MTTVTEYNENVTMYDCGDEIYYIKHSVSAGGQEPPKLHREDGPARINKITEKYCFFINGINITHLIDPRRDDIPEQIQAAAHAVLPSN